MNVRFIVKDARIPQSALETMEKRLHQRLDGYYRTQTEDTSTLVVKITERKGIYKVEITMPYAQHVLRTENEEREMAMPALDKGIDILERQVKKHKTRLTRNLRDVPQPLADVEPEAADEHDYEVVKVKQYERKPMTVQDAILEMNLLEHSFFTFLNAQTQQVCTVYRRADGDYGLIELV